MTAHYNQLNLGERYHLDILLQEARSKIEISKLLNRHKSTILKINNIFICHELIYQYIDKDRKSGGPLYKLLARRGKKYKKRNIRNSGYKNKKAAAPKRPISKRPPAAANKTEIGHFEGDTVESKNHKGGIATFVDRKSKFLLIRRVEDKSSEEMKKVMTDTFKNSYSVLKSITLDNGSEFALHYEISKEIGRNRLI